MSEFESDYTIQLSLSKTLPENIDTGAFITPFHGEIEYFGPEEVLFEDPEIIGKLQGYFLDLQSAEYEGEHYFEILDAQSHALMECYALFNRRAEFVEESRLSSETLKALGSDFETFDDNFILFDRLELLPAHRGKGIGLWVMTEVLGYLCSAFCPRFVVIKPFPLQGELFDENESDWRKQMQLGQLLKDIDAGVKRLRGLYSKLGFVHVEGTDLMVAQSSLFMYE